LAAAHVVPHPAAALLYFTVAAKADLLGEPDRADVRRLTERDRDAFVRAACRYAYARGLEPQYRCQRDNAASLALAAAAGLTWFGTWEVVAPESPT
jgi:hypothetical protein